MQLEKRVDVLEVKVTSLQIENAEMRTTLTTTAKNLDTLTAIVLAEQQMFKLVMSFLVKNSHIIGGCLVAFGYGAYYAGVHHIIVT